MERALRNTPTSRQPLGIITMNFSIDVSSTIPPKPAEPPVGTPMSPEITDLLRQMLEVQREQLQYQRAAAAAHDMTARWRTFLSRWEQEFPDLASGCKKSLPHLERCYARMISELNERLDDDGEGVDNEFALQEFLDRY